MLSLEFLPYNLVGISVNKVKESIRPQLDRIKTELAGALSDYVFKGQAVNPRVPPTLLPDVQTVLQLILGELQKLGTRLEKLEVPAQPRLIPDGTKHLLDGKPVMVCPFDKTDCLSAEGVSDSYKEYGVTLPPSFIHDLGEALGFCGDPDHGLRSTVMASAYATPINDPWRYAPATVALFAPAIERYKVYLQEERKKIKADRRLITQIRVDFVKTVERVGKGTERATTARHNRMTVPVPQATAPLDE
jgi:hypothetical protein